MAVSAPSRLITIHGEAHFNPDYILWLERRLAAYENLRADMDAISEQQPKTLETIRRNGFVFATPLDKPDAERTEAEMWEKLAFTIYNDLCSVDNMARNALDRLDQEKP